MAALKPAPGQSWHLNRQGPHPEDQELNGLPCRQQSFRSQDGEERPGQGVEEGTLQSGKSSLLKTGIPPSPPHCPPPFPPPPPSPPPSPGGGRGRETARGSFFHLGSGIPLRRIRSWPPRGGDMSHRWWRRRMGYWHLDFPGDFKSPGLRRRLTRGI